MPERVETRPVRLERAKPEDAGRLAIIRGRAFFDEWRFVSEEDRKREFGREDPPLGPPGIMDVGSTSEMIASPECIYYKILLGERVVGGLTVAADAKKYPEENFWQIFVEPMYHDRGIGQAAFRQLFRLHPDVERWRLGTPEFHTKNRHFYERMGFTYLETWKPEHTWFRSAEYENVLPQEERLKL
jgi:GNAT superfamily N-acetyltransferase